MDIQEYISIMHNGKPNWFQEEVNNFQDKQRVNRVIELKEYLSGYHNILLRHNEVFNGKEYSPRRIVLQYAKTILNFATSYLLSKPITLSGTENVVNEMKKIYKKGNYNKIDFDILDKMIKYGYVGEYVYLDEEKEIKSKIINPEDSFPIFDVENNYIAFIESYTGIDHITYYTIYYPKFVEKWTNEKGNLNRVGLYENLSGLPIVYRNKNELDENFGRSDLEDIISILDSMEDLISKSTDAFYKYITGVPVIVGQQLKGNGLPKDVVGGGIVLDDGGEFKFVNNQFDYRAFDKLYKTLLQALLDVSSTPAVSMNKTDISNLSEVSIKLLFSLADMKAGMNERYMREGMNERFARMRRLMELKGITFADDEWDTLDVVFQYARPQNEKDIIGNLQILNDMGAISLETILENSPYTVDVPQEMERINKGN